DYIESIRTFEVEDQLSVSRMNAITIVPNVQSKFLTDHNISLLEYIEPDTLVWFKDVSFTLDVVKDSYDKAVAFWKALSDPDKAQNPQWIDPKFNFSNDKLLADQLADYNIIEFGKQFFFTPDESVFFDIKPQPSFNKDFNLLIHHFKENEKQQLQNLIFT